MSYYSGYDDISYFISHPDSYEQMAWNYGMLRYGSQTEAIAYALGIESFEESRRILGYDGNGQVLRPVTTAKRQLELLWNKRRRNPRYVLEIGGGRGEVSIGLSYLGIFTCMMEPSKSVFDLIRQTKIKFNISEQPIIINTGITALFTGINSVDTVILVETIEHIEAEDFDRAFVWIKDILTINHGLLIITNWIDYHPIFVDPPWHIRRVDDELYDWLAQDGKTVYRNGSHLVVRYGEGR